MSYTVKHQGCLNIYSHTRINQKHISSSSQFFKGELIIKVFDDRIEFRKPSICYEGKRHKMSICKNKFHTAVSADIPNGRYLFDQEESDEDKVVVFFSEKAIEEKN